MISKIILLCGAICAFTCYGQTYSYSFNGELSNEKILEINDLGSKIDQIEEFKIRYKEDSQRGEILIHVNENTYARAEADNQLDVTLIKALLIQFGLNPMSFRKIKS